MLSSLFTSSSCLGRSLAGRHSGLAVTIFFF
jgi:hypothetical protein